MRWLINMTLINQDRSTLLPVESWWGAVARSHWMAAPSTVDFFRPGGFIKYHPGQNLHNESPIHCASSSNKPSLLR